MHYALLYNYLGIEEIHGSDLQAIGRRQVERFGGTIRDELVTAVAHDRCGLHGHARGWRSRSLPTTLIMTEGRNPQLTRSLGPVETDGGISVDRRGRSSIDRLYVVGRSVRPERSQAIISAGDGAAAALDILSREAGKDVHDWDSPPKAGVSRRRSSTRPASISPGSRCARTILAGSSREVAVEIKRYEDATAFPFGHLVIRDMTPESFRPALARRDRGPDRRREPALRCGRQRQGVRRRHRRDRVRDRWRTDTGRPG